jgi:hypothetical protein
MTRKLRWIVLGCWCLLGVLSVPACQTTPKAEPAALTGESKTTTEESGKLHSHRDSRGHVYHRPESR